MKIYHKIQSIYKRDPATNHKTFLEGEWSDPAFEILRDLPWLFTEKIDGMNIRVGWDDVTQTVTFGGRSDNADIPGRLKQHLTETFTAEKLALACQGPVTLIGEGYGQKIQDGGGYTEGQKFILFDVFCEPDEQHPVGIFLDRSIVAEIADCLSIPVVPLLFKGPLLDGYRFVQQGPVPSLIATDANKESEGVVARPATELCNRFGQRVITKIKYRDFSK